MRLRSVVKTHLLGRRFFSKSASGIDSQVCGVIGAQWGDEGKGKLADVLAKDFDVVARFNGGANAGHTIEANGKKFAFHLLPCGLVHPHTLNILGNGLVVNLQSLMTEIEPLAGSGIDIKGRLKISNRSHLLFEFYKEVDEILENRRDADPTSTGKIGTTKKGIGPAYTAKALRIGVRTGDLLHWDSFVTKYHIVADSYMDFFKFSFDKEAELKEMKQHREFLLEDNMIIDSMYEINAAYDAGKKILVEGANAAMLDLDFGSYPFVTSSTTTTGNISTGLGLSPNKIGSLIGVVKAYTTRVGSGPFPTELPYETDKIGRELQEVGKEFGVTTGRRRRCGWLDIPLLRYSHTLNGYASINITKLDVMDGLETVELCVDYKNKVTGELMPRNAFPDSMINLEQVEPVYKSFKGWKTSTCDARKFSELPAEAQAYIHGIEQELGVPVSWIGVGAARDAMILKE